MMKHIPSQSRQFSFTLAVMIVLFCLAQFSFAHPGTKSTPWGYYYDESGVFRGEDTPTPGGPPTETPNVTPTDTPTHPPTDTPTESPTETPTDTPTETPTESPTSTPTDTPTQTATNTPTPGPTPVVLMAGYFTTSISTTEGGELSLVAFTNAPDTLGIQSVELFYEGIPLGIFLDQSSSPDIFELAPLRFLPGVSPQRVFLQARMTTITNQRSRTWPYLTVD